jgi:transposase
MRPAGTPEQLAARCKRALTLLAKGQTPTAVARVVGATRRTIYRWKDTAQQPRATQPPTRLGRPSRLNTRQLRRLEGQLRRGAFVHGYAEEYWTLDRVAQLIWRLFQVRYHPSGVWHLLTRMGWSSQRPQRQAVQRDDAKIAHWTRYGWPQIKKVSRAGGQPGL